MPPSMDDVAPGDVSAFLRDQLDPWFVWATTSDDGPCKAVGHSKVFYHVLDYNPLDWFGYLDENRNACGFG